MTYSTAAANLKGKIGSVAVSTIDGTFSIAVTSISVGAGVSGTVPAELDAKLTSSGLKYLENTSMSVQSVKVGNTTYYVINSTSAKSTSSMAANVSEVVDAIGSSIAFASMDDMIMQIKKDLGSDIKSIVLDASEVKDGKAQVKLNFNTFADLNNAMDLSLHVGSDSSDDNKINMSISMMSARGLGVNGLNVSGDSDKNATRAIDTIADAISKVSSQRATLGAVQNRLEHTISNLDNVVENTTAAESEIRDTDMATQMVEYSKNQILAQAGQSMLAQANSANQGVLSLLQ